VGNLRFAAMGLVLGLAASCPTKTVDARPDLGVDNGTTLRVTLVVNGHPVAEVAPKTGRSDIKTLSLPELPWIVEARSPSGRVLTSMRVDMGDVTREVGPNYVGTSGQMGRIDLSCGRLTIWAGPTEPSGPMPVGSVGTPGDCDP
jgi:hypothetical protein